MALIILREMQTKSSPHFMLTRITIQILRHEMLCYLFPHDWCFIRNVSGMSYTYFKKCYFALFHFIWRVEMRNQPRCINKVEICIFPTANLIPPLLACPMFAHRSTFLGGCRWDRPIVKKKRRSNKNFKGSFSWALLSALELSSSALVLFWITEALNYFLCLEGTEKRSHYRNS